MTDDPRSPRERILQEAAIEASEVSYDPAQLDDPVVARLADAAEAAAEARAQGPVADLEEEWSEEGDSPAPPEVITVGEIEAQVARLDDLLANMESLPLHQVLTEADDALQGVCVILGMGFSGDVQMLTLAALQRFRKIKHYG